MNLATTTLICLLACSVVQGARAEPAVEVNEFRALVATAPADRTKDQKERIRDLWRSNEDVRKSLRGIAVLKEGDSIFDFPGLIHGKSVQYDAGKKEYSMTDRYSQGSPDGGKDLWDVRVTFSEDGIVTHAQRLKVNSR
jgi:hypothetical protein